MEILNIINLCLAAVFLLCYFYQFIMLAIAIFCKPKRYPDAPPKDIAVIIAARNESAVIKNLIDSLKAQDYPKHDPDAFIRH